MTAQGSSRWVAYLALIGAAILWGSNHVVARGLHETVPLVSLSFWRWIGAFFLILPLAWRHLSADAHRLRQSSTMLLWLAFVGIFLFTYTIYLAAYGTAAVNVGLINATTPIWVLMISAVLFADRPTPLQWLGVIISLGGVLAIIVKADLDVLIGLKFGVGDIWALVAAIVWAVYSLMLKKSPTGVNPFSTLTVVIGLGVMMHLPVFTYSQLVLAEPVFTHAVAPLGDIAKIAYVAFGPAFLGYVFWNKGVRAVGPAVAGVFLYLIPVASSLLAIAFLGETLELYHFGGIVLIASGIYLTSRSG